MQAPAGMEPRIEGGQPLWLAISPDMIPRLPVVEGTMALPSEA